MSHFLYLNIYVIFRSKFSSCIFCGVWHLYFDLIFFRSNRFHSLIECTIWDLYLFLNNKNIMTYKVLKSIVLYHNFSSVSLLHYNFCWLTCPLWKSALKNKPISCLNLSLFVLCTWLFVYDQQIYMRPTEFTRRKRERERQCPIVSKYL